MAALVTHWLRRGPAVFAGDDRESLDALCRQVDVRKKVSAGYGPDWKRLDPEVPAEPVVVSGLVAVLLANAAGVGSPGPDGSRNDGWGLKCTNSALKALELREQTRPTRPNCGSGRSTCSTAYARRGQVHERGRSR